MSNRGLESERDVVITVHQRVKFYPPFYVEIVQIKLGTQGGISASEFNGPALMKCVRRQLGYVGNIPHKDPSQSFSLRDPLTSPVDL